MTVKQIASNIGVDLDSPDIIGINSPVHPTTDLPWMEINYQWLKSNLTVYVIIDSTNKTEKHDTAAEAIQEWLNLLRTRSSNSTTWNVELHYVNVNNSTVYRTDPPDIILVMYDEHDRRKCAKYYGKADSFHEDNRPQYTKIFTTCGTEHLSEKSLYNVLSHEFAHTLGLGHTHSNQIDLMCGRDNQGENTCPILRYTNVIPSQLNTDTLLYVYGKDGFGAYNRAPVQNPYYIMASNSSEPPVK